MNRCGAARMLSANCGLSPTLFNLSMLNARVELEKDLRAAIALNQFQLHYQLQIDNKGYAIGAELLIRWLHPERGRVMPSEFIPFAEATGLIVNIGMWVLEAACGQLKRWADHPKTHHLRLSLNVSAVQFKHADFATLVIAEGVETYLQHAFLAKHGCLLF